MKLTKKHALLISVLAVLMALCTVAGATLAYLFVQTEPVVNTFSPSNIGLTLEETTGETYKMVPGTTIAKDPKVTVKNGSEACWLYVKVIKNDLVNDYLTVTIASDWTQIEGTDVWYYSGDIVQGTPISVLANDQVTVKDSVTEAMMEALEVQGAMLPTLTFEAYAVQKEAGATAVEAWNATYGATSSN